MPDDASFTSLYLHPPTHLNSLIFITYLQLSRITRLYSSEDLLLLLLLPQAQLQLNFTPAFFLFLSQT